MEVYCSFLEKPGVVRANYQCGSPPHVVRDEACVQLTVPLFSGLAFSLRFPRPLLRAGWEQEAEKKGMAIVLHQLCLEGIPECRHGTAWSLFHRPESGSTTCSLTPLPAARKPGKWDLSLGWPCAKTSVWKKEKRLSGNSWTLVGSFCVSSALFPNPLGDIWHRWVFSGGGGQDTS